MEGVVHRVSNPRKMIGIGVVILGVLCILLFALELHAVRVQHERAALQEEMSPFVISASNDADDVRTLRSKRYAIETRFDPLFAVAGSDTDGMRKALIPLQNEAAMILGTYSSEERATIEPVLYPRTFLTILPDLEDARRSVVHAPTPESVRHYDSLLRKTIQAYRDDITLYQRTLTALPPSDRNTTLNYLAGTTSVSEVIGKLEQLDAHALELETKRHNRYRCFSGDRIACIPLSESFATFVEPSQTVTPTAPPTPLERSLTYRDIVREAFVQMLGTQETYDTVVQLSRSECLSGTPAAYYFFFQSKEEEGIFSSTATPLNELYFYDLEESIRSQKNPPAYLRTLYDNGLRYNYQNIGNLYFCPNSGNVLADASTLVALYRKIRTDPVFAEFGGSYPELARLEKKFIDAAIPSEADMDGYFSAVKETLRNDGEHRLTDQIGAVRLFEIEEMLHEWSNRSSHFEQSLTAAHHINRLSKGIISQSHAPLYSFLTGRVYPSIFFMTFNKSTVGESYLFLDSINAKPSLTNFHLVPYSTGMRSIFDKVHVFEELRHEQKIIDAVLRVER